MEKEKENMAQKLQDIEKEVAIFYERFLHQMKMTRSDSDTFLELNFLRYCEQGHQILIPFKKIHKQQYTQIFR